MKHGGRWAVCVFAVGIAAVVVYGIVPGPSPDVLTFSNGGLYVGATRAGRPHGHGVYTFPDGKRHEGEFRDGKPNGYGVRMLADGDRSADRIVAQWNYGKLTFPVRRVDRYEGEWRNGELVFQVNEIPVRSPAFWYPIVRHEPDGTVVVLHHPILPSDHPLKGSVFDKRDVVTRRR